MMPMFDVTAPDERASERYSAMMSERDARDEDEDEDARAMLLLI